MSVPDPLGRDRLAAGAAMYKPPVYGEKPPAKPWFRTPRFLAIVATVALIAAFVAYKVATRTKDSPQAAALGVITLFLDEDYKQLRSKLCREDRQQVEANDLETAGRSAGPLLKAFDKPEVTSVTDVTLVGTRAGQQAKQVTGQITATVGQGSGFKVVTVKEGGSWRACLSAGGYGLSAFNLDVPIGGDLEDIG